MAFLLPILEQRLKKYPQSPSKNGGFKDVPSGSDKKKLAF